MATIFTIIGVVVVVFLAWWGLADLLQRLAGVALKDIAAVSMAVAVLGGMAAFAWYTS
jgi:hypothetical protein